MIVLGIESSHDDTSVALVKDNNVIFNYSISQIEIHKVFGGTVPEIASREHYNNFYVILNKILSNTKFKDELKNIDAIAYTEKPGLIGTLQMGKLFSFALAHKLKKPIYGINHLDGHIFSVLLTDNESEKEKIISYPAIALVASGGHTNLYLLHDVNNKELIGQTLDDAIGEVFDKVARNLGFGFPGGPIIDQIFNELKQENKLNKIHFNFSKTENEFDFSFSGFKTQVVNMLKQGKETNKKQIAFFFQKNVVDYVMKIVNKSIEKYQPKSLILSGGVSANSYLREQFLLAHKNVFLPKKSYATDNGAMIAKAYIEMNK